MAQKFETYAYNFNPRESYKDIKIRHYMKQGVIRRGDFPAGTITSNIKYETKCKQTYLSYNNCLKSNMFDRQICKPKEQQVIQCEHRQGLYKSNDIIIDRLKQGLQNSQKRRQEEQEKFKQQHLRYQNTDSSNVNDEEII